MKFSLHAQITQYCDYIIAIMQDRTQYNELALSAYNEFVTRLNWKVSSSLVTALIDTVR